jgi:hypothetical protein
MNRYQKGKSFTLNQTLSERYLTNTTSKRTRPVESVNEKESDSFSNMKRKTDESAESADAILNHDKTMKIRKKSKITDQDSPKENDVSIVNTV